MGHIKATLNLLLPGGCGQGPLGLVWLKDKGGRNVPDQPGPFQMRRQRPTRLPDTLDLMTGGPFLLCICYYVLDIPRVLVV